MQCRRSMTTPVQHALLGITIAILSSSTIACSSDQCEQQPDSIFCAGADDEAGDTGTDGTDTGILGIEGCVPSIEPSAIGYEYSCQGNGNGWLVLDVVPTGTQPPECVNWGPDGRPANPSTADCVPVDLTMLPNDVPSPGACCTEMAKAETVENQCEEDCGYAACNLAITKIREAAYALPHPDSTGLKKTAEERVRSDLFGMASMLDLPGNLDQCAGTVTQAKGEPVAVLLGAGISGEGTLGHIDDATLTLQCSLDALEPFVLQEGVACESTPNIPLIDDESNLGGIATAGAITMFGPSSDSSTDLSNITFEFRESSMRDGSIDFLLTSFDADAEDADHGSFSVVDPHIRLAAPVSATLVGDTVSFPAGSLRMEVSGVVVSNGEVLFGGQRSSGVYVNTGAAIVARTADGFAFVDAPFEAGGYRFVLNTEEGSAQVQ